MSDTRDWLILVRGLAGGLAIILLRMDRTFVVVPAEPPTDPSK